MTAAADIRARHRSLGSTSRRSGRILISAAAWGVLFATSAAIQWWVYASPNAAIVSLLATATCLLALLALKFRHATTVAANLVLGALCIQILGGMAVSGGLTSALTPLAPMIIPAAHLVGPNSRRWIQQWSLLVIVILGVIGAMDHFGLSGTTDMTADLQRLDQLLTLLVGVLTAAALAGLSSSEVYRAFRQLDNERKAFEHQALYDTLTGLPNRQNFFNTAERLLDEAETNGHICELVYLDVDRFKLLNDTLGHAAGDSLLQQIGEQLSRYNSDDCIAARLAGDEFVLMRRVDPARQDAGCLYEMIESLRHQWYTLDGCARDVSFSAGIARYPGDGSTLDALMHHADQAMYRDKRAATRTQSPDAPAVHGADRPDAVSENFPI